MRAATDCLERAVLEHRPEGMERRHEAVVEWAVAELDLDRGRAEQIYALAEEERLEPVYAFQLVRCGVGVRELERPVPDPAGAAMQQAPPAWITPAAVEPDDVVLERRLRVSFRRFRGLLESEADPAAAARAYMAQPDVASLRLV